MRDVLIDVRCLQEGEGGEALDVLRQARAALGADALIGLADPGLPELPGAVRALLDGVRCNAYTRGAQRPTCLVQLSPLTHDPLFVARLLLDRRVPCVSLAPEGRSSERLQLAVAQHWLARYDHVLPASMLLPCVAALRPGAPPSAVIGEGPRVAVVTVEPGHPLCRALPAFANVEVFAADAPLAALAWHTPRFDRVVSLVANTPAHGRIVALAARLGGAVVLEDGCLLAAYAERPEAAVRLAEAESGRKLAPGELAHWHAGTFRPAAQMLGELAAAQPLIVYSESLRREVASRHGRDAVVVPRPVRPGRRLGRSEEARVLAYPAGRLAAETCLWAVEMLRAWGTQVALTLACAPSPELEALCRSLAVDDRVAFAGPALGEAAVCVFLATSGQPSLAGPLAEAAAHGLPCIASRSLVASWDAPPWVRPVPDEPSPPLLAEAVLAALEHPRSATAEYLRAHEPARCAAALAAALGIA